MTAVAQEPAGLQVLLGIGAQALLTPATRRRPFYTALGPRLIKGGRRIYYVGRNSETDHRRRSAFFCKSFVVEGWKFSD